MRFSKYYVPTLKEDPAEAEIISHKLLLRGGFIRKLASGIYSFLPMGLRVLNKISRIVREEMNNAGAIEVLLPIVQPAELWKETGRWDKYGKELLRFKDRHERDFCLGPTHEEVITDLVRHEIRSYRQLPLNLYQIHTKFRDEIRPRFGLMRCREFIMKDGYSFDKDEEGAKISYEKMFKAYQKIFKRIGLDFRAVEADTGQIGGSFSHEFMVLAETGEDVIVVCERCEFAANIEKAEVRVEKEKRVNELSCPDFEMVYTPSVHTAEEVAKFLKVSKAQIVKTLIYKADNMFVAALIPGDRELNETKLKNILNVVELELASYKDVERISGCKVGFAGPVGLKVDRIIADNHLLNSTDLVTGANKEDHHLIHVDLKRDAQIDEYADIVNIEERDPCPRCGGKIKFFKGIEVGHIFKLGTNYSKAMKATFLDEKGQEREMVMGCYGIGISRIIAAAIEQNHDEDGMIFPPSIAPFEVVVIALNVKDQNLLNKAEKIYRDLLDKDIDVILDDRDERPGFKFKDADLLGFPIQVIIGQKGIQKGVVEVKNRKNKEKKELSLENFIEEFVEWRKDVWKMWNLL